MAMKDILNRMLNHEELTREETKEILIGITMSEYPNEQITALLTALQMRGITVDELLGFRDGILETGVPVPLDCDRYIDVVGTGGDRKNTFNISTTSCFVIAGAGYKVAKHGNYAATSTSGASNVIAEHGVKFTDDIDKLNRLHPYYLVYIMNTGELRWKHIESKKILDAMRLACNGKRQAIDSLCRIKEDETNDYYKMDHYSTLLKQSIHSFL